MARRQIKADEARIPTTEESVARAEEAMSIADVLRELSDQFNSIDNGHCTICRQFRLYDTRGNMQPCENSECLSYRIGAILERYEQPSKETLERIRRNCLQHIERNNHA